jgi:hypothetical protein
LRLGLVSRVVGGDHLAGATAEITASIARAPREVLLRTKAKMTRRAGIEVGGTLDL